MRPEMHPDLLPPMIQRKKKIVLYQPKQVDESLGLESSKDMLPLEMLQIGAIPDAEGHEVVIVDASLYTHAEAHRLALEACEGAAIFATTAILGYMVADGHFASEKVRVDLTLECPGAVA